MLNYLFGFNARIGRLTYVVATFALAVGLVMLVLGITGATPGRGRLDVVLAQAGNSGPLVIAFLAAIAINFMLQSMRIRDVGWDPVCVMVGWMALTWLDRVVAVKFPVYALTYHHTGTAVGALANLALTLALFFWPSSASDEAPQSYDRSDASDGYWRKASAPAAPSSRIARVANGEFGGRK